MCQTNGCDLENYEDLDKCILHCEKSEYSVDFHKTGFLRNFNDELIQYIAEQLNQYNSIDIALPYDDLVKYFSKGIGEIAEANRQIFIENIKTHPVIFNHIAFPARDSRDSFDYVKVLQKLGQIHFNYCEFQSTWLELQESELFFQDCIFHNRWLLNNFKVLENVDNVLYQNCTFEKEVTSSGENDKLELEETQFKDCKFESIQFENTIFKKPIFNNGEAFRGEIESIDIYDCEIEERFILNRHKINDIRLDNILFKEKFEFKDNTEVNCVILDTNFEGLADFYETTFTEFFIEKSIFKEFVGFEWCEFGSSGLNDPTKFQYVTFLSFINFRETKFLSGLDLRDANLKEYPNFLGAFIDPKNTNKETFRIIKYSFDKVGNTTEANKYFANEMDKERIETWFWNEPDKKIILSFNYFISNFGQSFMLPLMWILVLGIFHQFLIHWLDSTTIYDLFSHSSVNHDAIKSIVNNMNKFAKNILPFKKFLSEGQEFVSLLFLLGYSTLIYHFIVAVKRVTKR